MKRGFLTSTKTKVMHFTKQNNVQHTFTQSYFSADNTFFNKSLLDFILS